MIIYWPLFLSKAVLTINLEKETDSFIASAELER